MILQPFVIRTISVREYRSLCTNTMKLNNQKDNDTLLRLVVVYNNNTYNIGTSYIIVCS